MHGIVSDYGCVNGGKALYSWFGDRGLKVLARNFCFCTAYSQAGQKKGKKKVVGQPKGFGPATFWSKAQSFDHSYM
jgi:hypothetical protein